MTTIHAYTADQNLQDSTAQGPAPRPRRRAQHRADLAPAPPRRSAWCCPSSRASSTATRCGCRCPTGSATDLTFEAGRETSVEEVNAAVKAAADGSLPALHRGPDRLQRHRHRPGVVHLRRAADQGDRQPGQGRRLVRQRVGLLQPPRRPGHLRRRDALTGVGRVRLASATYAASGSWSGPTSTCRSTAPTITDDGRIRASVPDHPGAGRRRRPGRRRARTSAGPKGAPEPAYSLAPVAARLGELLGADVAFATDTVGESARGDGRRARRTARSRCSRTCGSTRARPARTTPSAARSPTSSPRSPTRSSPTGSGSCTASRPASTTSRSGCRTRWAAWCAPRSRCSGGSPRPRAALRRGARRLEGLRQARRHRQPARARPTGC